MYKENTEYGGISYGDAVPGSIVKRIVRDMEGRILLSTPKGKPLKLEGRTAADESGFIETEYAGGRLDMTVYVITRFGVSIQAAAAELTAGIRREAPGILGVKPDRIQIVITGVLSKNLSRRNVTVETYADAQA
jgi:uncharacterized alkaline shock family protein YloU